MSSLSAAKAGQAWPESSQLNEKVKKAVDMSFFMACTKRDADEFPVIEHDVLFELLKRITERFLDSIV